MEEEIKTKQEQVKTLAHVSLKKIREKFNETIKGNKDLKHEF
jgi:hypothetical protein